MQLNKAFGTNESLENEGKWFDIGDGAKVLVARFGNKAHKKVLNKLRAPYKPLLLRGGSIPEEKNEEIISESMAQTILLGWDGFMDQDMKVLPYSIEAARESFKLYPDFLDLVSQFSLDVSNFRSEMQEAVVKK